MAFIKPIREKGIIISKRYQDAKDARIDLNGKEWPATKEKFLVEVISCDEDDFNKETGILKGTRVEYPVDKATYEKAKFGMWANVKFQANVYGDKNSYQPLMFSLILNKE
ncbi:MAG: hypothetical protein ACI4L1_00595 [Christensenellales bacterium]